VKVKPGETHKLKVTAKGHKDETLTIDGTEDRVEIKLESKGGGSGPGTGGGTGPSTGGGPSKSYCEQNPLDPDCAQ
jgi:hypothetical protein